MEIYKYILVASAGYLLGSLSMSIILSRAVLGEDVRRKGSGNAGATNMARVYGLKAGALTLGGDVLKASLSMLIGWLLLGDVGLALGGIASLVGHCFPVYYNFRGGKGVSVGLIGTVLIAACTYFRREYRKTGSAAGAVRSLLRPTFIRKEYRRRGLEYSIGFVFAVALTMIDGVVSGHVLGQDALAATSIMFPLISFSGFFSGIVTNGCSNLCALAKGERDYERSNRLFTLGLMIGISVNDTTVGTTIANLGMTDVIFPHPLFEGDTVHCTTEVLSKRESKSRPGAGIVELHHRAYNQHGKLVAECKRQAFMRMRPL